MAIRDRRGSPGSGLLLGGSLALLALTFYEFSARAQVMWWALRGVYNLSIGEGVPLRRALSYFDPGMFYLVAFLLACVIYSILVLILRRKPVCAYMLIVLAIAFIAVGSLWFELFNFNILNWMDGIKLIPLLLIIAGCVLNLVSFHMRNARVRGHWRNMYEEEGIRARGPRGHDMQNRVKQSRRDGRYRRAG